jgi:formylmethanofuran dehydrogenase subunit C
VIRLALRQPPPLRLSLAGITPETLGALSEGEIARLPLRRGNRQETLGDWFSVERAGGPAERLVIAADDDRLDEIGAGLSAGEIVVEGSTGAHAGRAMAGGALLIEGNAGYGAATAMRGGRLRIAGNAGDQLGGALPGDNLGMREGLVLVGGSAGSGAGDRMRRGTIVIAGDAGPFCATRLFAGTIVVGGRLGPHPGILMRRGSLVALGPAPPAPSGFAECGVHDLTLGKLVARFLAAEGFSALAERLEPLRRWLGDLAIPGRGEILALPNG